MTTRRYRNHIPLILNILDILYILLPNASKRLPRSRGACKRTTESR